MRVWVFPMLMIGATLGCYRDVAAPASAGTVTAYVAAVGVPAPVVQRIEVYVTEIAASTEIPGDSAPVEWVVIARPDRTFEIPRTVGGRVSLGFGLVPVGVYSTVRLSVDGEASRVWLADGSLARVRWPQEGVFPLFAVAEHPVEVWPEATEVVIELDVSQSFSTLLADPLHDLVFAPVVRVVGPARAHSLSTR